MAVKTTAAFVVVPKASHGSSVTASVGEFYLNLAGYQSPFASIALTSENVFYRGTVADQTGNFTMSSVLIKQGFTSFCLQAVDYKRLGDSEACFKVPPATGSITKKDMFLPPTLGLLRTEIAAGGEAVGFGFSMPGATVRLHISNGVVLTTTADTTGYYEFRIKNLAAGNYTLYADAVLKGKPSEGPSRVLSLHALSLWEQFLELLKRLFNWLIGILLGIPLGLLWLAIPMLILIFILIGKLWPEKFTWLTGSKGFIYLHRFLPLRRLHHWWFVGY